MNTPNEADEEYFHREDAENSKILKTNKDFSNYDSLSKKREPYREDDGSSKNTENYKTKQKELSSWYYIKSNPKPKVMSIYDETKSKNLSSRHNFSSTSLQKFRSIDDLIQRQSTVIQNETSNYDSKEHLIHESMTPSFNPDIDIDIESEDYIQSIRVAATKLKNQQINNYSNKLLPSITSPASYPEDLSSSYASLDCPPPPNPQRRLISYFKAFYIELAIKEQILPSWVHQSLSPSRLEPELRFSSMSHGLNELISIDQILAPVQMKDGSFLEAPKRVFIECPPWLLRSSLGLRILYNWAKDDGMWPQNCQPVFLALFIPLNEVAKGSLQAYISKELMSINFLNFFSNSSTWNVLESLGGNLLIIIDTCDIVLSRSSSNKSKHTCDDIINLLEGRLLPESRLILMGGSSQSSHLLQFTQRHIKYDGILWRLSALLLGDGKWGPSTRLLDAIQKSHFLKGIVRSPIGCVAISQVYESIGREFEIEDEVDIIEAIFNNVIAPDTNFHQPHSVELGRLALFCLKMKHSGFSTTELKLYCSTPNSPFLGCFEKSQLFGKTAKKRGEFFYSPICTGVLEFLAAIYLVSLANRPELLGAEIAGLSFLDDSVEADVLKVLKYAMTLMGDRAYILLTKLTVLWLSPQTVLSLALAATETESNLNALCDMLGITKAPSISPLETSAIWVTITSSANELQGWGLALKSPICALKNLEIMYQIEKTVEIESRNSLNIFLDALSGNESVTTLRISALIENDVHEKDINFLAMSISRALLKKKLENFELIITQLEEDPPAMKLQSVVSALCKSISNQTRLESVLLDLGLGTSQIVQISSTLERCSHVTRLSLPHLKCERGAVNALASLLRKRPLISLALPACWGARDDPPSSSGVSMGSASGSSSGNSGLIKQSSLTGTHSPRTFAPGVLFCSLPRGSQPALTLSKSQTLPRQLLENINDKRSQDSVFSNRSWIPTPSCEGSQHSSGTLHELLCAAREPFSRLHGLDLSKAQLSLEDSMCLGETVRTSKTLHSLKVEGASRISEILPSILGASESSSLQMLNFASPRLVLEDAVIEMLAKSLSCCSTLRLLGLDGWSFKFDTIGTLSQTRCFLSVTHVREIGLSNCKIHLPFNNTNFKPPNDLYDFSSIVVLKLAGTQIILLDQTPIRGPQLLTYLKGFKNLRELDLSAPIHSGFGSSSSAVPPLIVDDKSFTSFFTLLTGKFWSLSTLKICNWIVHLDSVSKTLKHISKSLKSSTLSHMKIDGISIIDRSKRVRAEPQFLQVLISSIPQLRWISVSLLGLNEEHIGLIGKSIRDIKSPEIDIRLNDATIENVRLMTTSLSSDGKFDIRVSTFGTSSNILLHVEKIGGKSSSILK